MQPTIAAYTLFYGDNLPILREYIPDESMDLLYLDPPFNSNRNYNVLFKDESGKISAYETEAGKVWIITEADRASTCILLPEEY